jgi:ribosomal protein L16 Arg81 hydroxylase
MPSRHQPALTYLIVWFELALLKSCLQYVCVQEAGDVLFVPSGWHHMVSNELPTLSINHNWLNGHNVHWAWALLRKEHQQATQQLEDCR